MARKYLYIFLFLLFMFFFIVPSSILALDHRRPFICPLRGEIITGFREEYFDIEHNTCIRHTGIDIEGEPGGKVSASANGIISYTGFSPTGGLTVVIRHNGRIRTTYLNLAGIFVNRGDIVKQGDIIACLGVDDDISSEVCHLHFAVIYENTYLDPAELLEIDYSSISRFLMLAYSGQDYRVY